MSEHTPLSSSAHAATVPWTVALLFGPLCLVAGAVGLAAAAGYIPMQPSQDPLPAWWTLAFGVFFAAGGAWLLLVRLSRWLAMPFGLVAVLTFVWICNWIPFGPGPRHFQTSSSVNGVVIERSSTSEFEGRLVFGIVAALMDLALAYGVVTALRARLDPAGSASSRATEGGSEG
jgi:hypothetical protein